MILHLVAAARPNFMKIAPLYHAMQKHRERFDIRIIHTGQHYDRNMSDSFFEDFHLPVPDVNFNIGGGSHAEQTAGILLAYEKYAQANRPDLVIVVGDVNATMACTLVAKKLNLKVAHLEAGLRSYDLTMPEEINRMVTDAIADIFWTPSSDADANLMGNGIAGEKITFVGNIMIDSFEMLRDQIMNEAPHDAYGLKPGEFGVATFHRPSNVDNKEQLFKVVDALKRAAVDMPIIFPVHPRTKARLQEYGLWETLVQHSGVVLDEPLSYIRFMGLVTRAKWVMTDSGGIQEESTYLGIP